MIIIRMEVMMAGDDMARARRWLVGSLAKTSLHFARLIPCSVPLQSEHHSLDPRSENLFVLLPGIQDRFSAFETAGFIEAAKQRNLNADLLAVDAHVGYYARERILERLHTDIIGPARNAGYKKIWLVGTSLGGIGSVLYAGKHEEELTGVLLLAPFLGEQSVIRQIEHSGGPKAWATRDGDAGKDFKLELWKWLAKYFDEPERKPNLFLGFGEGDRFAYANRYLAEALSADRVIVTPGGHDWMTWQKLWVDFLERYSSAS